MSIFAGLMLFWLVGVPLLVVGLALCAAWRRERSGKALDRVDVAGLSRQA